MDNAFARKLFTTGILASEDLELYRNQTAAFRRKFGREMGPDDPFFFDPDADTPQFRRPADAHVALDMIAGMMAEAGLDPAAIYAFKRTRGLFPTSAGRLTESEVQEWNAAIAEYSNQLARSATH